MTIFSDIKKPLASGGQEVVDRYVLLFPLPASRDWIKGSIKLLFGFLIIIAEKKGEDKRD